MPTYSLSAIVNAVADATGTDPVVGRAGQSPIELWAEVPGFVVTIGIDHGPIIVNADGMVTVTNSFDVQLIVGDRDAYLDGGEPEYLFESPPIPADLALAIGRLLAIATGSEEQ